MQKKIKFISSATPTCIYTGIFLIAASMLYLEVFLTRLLSFIIGPHYVYYTIAIAMLGMSAASVYVSVNKKHDATRSYLISGLLCLLTSISVIALFVFSTEIKDQINLYEIAKFKQEGFNSFINYIRDSEFQCSLMIGLVMSVPYMFIGAVLSIVFRGTSEKTFHRLYFIDLLGACFGCVVAILSLEFLDYDTALLLSVLLPVFAALAFFSHSQRHLFKMTIVIGLLLAFLISSPGTQKYIEPQPNIIRLARLYQYKEYTSAKEIWRTWTSYGRVSAVERIGTGDDGKPFSTYVMAHGNGEGHAHVPRFNAEGARVDTRLAIAGCNPEDILVIFAGVGNDMAQFKRLTQGNAKVTGIELVPQIAQWPRTQSQFRLDEIFSNSNMNLLAEEGREYLARDKTKYDCILASWSGASTSYYTGTAAHAASYVYTSEGLASMLDHLKPGGQLTLLNGSKIRIIFSLRDYFKKRGISDISDKIVLAPSVANVLPTDWSNLMDNQILLVKPAGFSENDLKKIASESIGPITFSKNETAKHAKEYEKAVKTTDVDSLLNFWRTKYQIDLSAATDDKPFRGNLFPNSAYLSAKFWQGKVDNGQWKVNLVRAKTLLWFIAIALALIISPLLIRRNNLSWSTTTRSSLIYFGLVGIAFMLMEVGIIMKLMLLTGHPGYTIAIVLASIVFFTGIGSLISDFVIENKILSLRGVCIAAGIAIFVALYLSSYANTNLVGLSRFSKLLIAFLIPAIPTIFMGHLFPQGLKRIAKENDSLVPWAIAINGAMGTIASGLSPIVTEVCGINFLIGGAAVLYLLLGVLSSRSIFR